MTVQNKYLLGMHIL